MGDENMNAVRRFFLAINDDDADAMCAELDTDVLWRVPAIHPITPAREFRGHDAVRAVWDEVKENAGGPLRVVLHEIEGDESGVFAAAALRGPGFATPIAYVIEMRDRRISRAQSFVHVDEARAAWQRRS